jgi:hypothetical protein
MILHHSLRKPFSLSVSRFSIQIFVGVICEVHLTYVEAIGKDREEDQKWNWALSLPQAARPGPQLVLWFRTLFQSAAICPRPPTVIRTGTATQENGIKMETRPHTSAAHWTCVHLEFS